MKFSFGVLHKKLSNKHKFNENQVSNSLAGWQLIGYQYISCYLNNLGDVVEVPHVMPFE